MATFTQELSSLQDYLQGLEQRLSRTLCYTGQEMPSWEQLSEADQKKAVQLGNDISVVCHHLLRYTEELPAPQRQEQSGASTDDGSESDPNMQPLIRYFNHVLPSSQSSG